MVSDCPDIALLESHATPEVRDHLASCSSCRVVVDLLEERRRGIEARDRRDECAKFELLLAARQEGTIGGTAETLLDAHLRDCRECQAVAATMPPASERREHSALPAISTAAYALGREVARGGMGRILEAHDLRIGRPVAVKELLGKAPALAARFEREARVTARLQHPGIVPIYEIGTWPDGTPFYSMRMVEGQTLRKMIGSKRTLDERLALLPALIAAAEAVAFAHGKKVIHRDLTPTNILVGDYGDTVVIDWGLAKDLSRRDDTGEDRAASPYRDESANDPSLTSAGAVMGTAAYMPPEQAAGSSVDQRADVYALGAILYQTLAGQPPYRGTRNDELIRDVQAGPPPPISTVAPGAPRDLISIVEKAMSREPANRYPSASELVDELRRFQTGRLVEAHHYSHKERMARWIRAHRARVLAATTAIVAVGVVGTVGLVGVLRERARAERGEKTAVEQRAAAESSKDRALRDNARLMEEQGRQELLAGNTTRALAWLNAAYKQGDSTPELRFMLGAALQGVESQLHTFDCRLNGHSPDTPALSFSPDGTRALAACDGGIGIASVSDWRVVLLIPTTSQGAVWSHDGKWIASKRYDTLSVWDSATGAPVFSAKAHVGSTRNIMFTPDDRLVITSGDDAKARVWDVATGRELRAIDAGSGRMNVVRSQLTPDGQTLVTITSDGVVRRWLLSSGQLQSSFALGVQPLGRGSISVDGRQLATCHVDGTVRVTDLSSGKLMASFGAHAHAAFDCQFSRDGRWLVTTGADGAARVWDVPRGHMISSLEHGGVFASAAISPDGQRIATLASDGVLRVWHAASGSLLSTFDDPVGMTDEVTFSNDGRFLVGVRDGSTIVVMKDDVAHDAIALAPGSTVVGTSPTASQMAIKDATGNVAITSTTTGIPLSREVIREPVTWSHDGSRVAAATGDGAIVLDARNGSVIARVKTSSFDALALDDRGQTLLVASAHSQIWDVETARLRLTLDGSSDASSLSPDGRVAISWRDPRQAEIWNVGTGAVRARVSLDADLLGTVGFVADGRHVLLGVKDTNGLFAPIPFAGRVGGYDLDTGARTYELPHAILTFLSPDRQRIVASGVQRDMEIRDAHDGSLVSRIMFGSELLFAGTLAMNNELLLAIAPNSLDIRSTMDGRLLARLHLIPNMSFTQDMFNAGANFDVANDGRIAIALSAYPVIWRLPFEERSPQQVDTIVRERVRWQIADGRLVASEANLRGRVMRHGKPVAGATVTLEHVGSMSWPRVTTDPAGQYRFDHLPLGELGVLAMAPDLSAHGQHPVTLVRGDVVGDIDLDEEATVSGVVVDERGEPVPGARVEAVDTFLEGVSDERGAFTIRALRPGRFTIAVVEQADGKPTGFEHSNASPVAVEIRTKTDSISNVRLVVRKTAR